MSHQASNDTASSLAHFPSGTSAFPHYPVVQATIASYDNITSISDAISQTDYLGEN